MRHAVNHFRQDQRRLERLTQRASDARARGRGMMTDVTPFQELLYALEDAGLWLGTSEDQKRALIGALDSGEDATWTGGGAWHADGEDLADGDVEAWLGNMAAPLKDCGVELKIATVSAPTLGSAGYSVRVNGTTLNLYAFAQDNPRLPATEDPWMDCTVEPASEVNRLLEAAGSSCRVALFWPGGNDGFSVLGEQSVLRRVCAGGAASSSWDCLIP